MREGGTKAQKEIGVVLDLLASMETAGDVRFLEPQPSPIDPPDCVASLVGGGCAAIEVTELVCQEAIERNQRADREAIARFEPGAMVHREWRQTEFLDHLGALLSKKDYKYLRGGPYDLYTVVVHTNEPWLFRADCERWLSGHSFGPYTRIAEAYLLYQYEPGNGDPYQRLSLRERSGDSPAGWGNRREPHCSRDRPER
jgi:hypothetical protein